MEFIMNKASLQSQGIDPKGVLDFIALIKQKGIKLHTFTMARNEKIVAEVKAFPYDQNYRHIINSCTKTFTSLAVGICYDRGLIKLDDRVTDYIQNENASENGLSNLTIRHLLTMSVGHDHEPCVYADREWSLRLLDKPLTYPSGSLFFYNNMASHTLSAIVQKVSGQSEYELLKECFFDKCGFEDYYWINDPYGVSFGAAGLYVRPIDLLKLGQLYLNKGILNGQRIVSEEWVELATQKEMETAPAYPAHKTENCQGYGFQLWRCTHNGYRASGLFGQVCLVLPDKNLVAVFNSSTTGSQPLLDAFFETIYPCIGDQPLSEDENAYKLIEEAQKSLDIKPLSGTSKGFYVDRVNNKKLKSDNSNREYQFDFNNDELLLHIFENGNEYKMKLKENGFASMESNYDNYTMSRNDFYIPTKKREINSCPIVYGSYAWVSNTHLKLLLIIKDHTLYTNMDVYFDCKKILIDEKIEYNSDTHTDIQSDILSW